MHSNPSTSSNIKERIQANIRETFPNVLRIKSKLFGPIKFQLPKPANYIHMHISKRIGDIYGKPDSYYIIIIGLANYVSSDKSKMDFQT